MPSSPPTYSRASSPSRPPRKLHRPPSSGSASSFTRPRSSRPSTLLSYEQLCLLNIISLDIVSSLTGAAAAGRQARSSSPAVVASWPPLSRSATSTTTSRSDHADGGRVATRGRPVGTGGPAPRACHCETPPPNTPNPC
ncbi:uncharacterized protein LOC125515645 [Triticum urartu]|uniref:uncharacterized protein LOC125515645 n=1 Tax=Triticum urartu TaxID=4572 RepID=UPI00204379A9|nr:uncharacterized protein LOC125515645 [Triticum urartu]